MKLRSNQYYVRKSHRYLGVILGVQFLFWTLGGLYFSWNDIGEVHGDHLRGEKKYFPASMSMVSPQVVLETLHEKSQVDSVLSIQLIEIAGTPTYQIRYFSGELEHAAHEANSHKPNHSTNVKVRLANAETGEYVAPLSENVAVTVARNQLANPIKVDKVEYLTEVGSHHEYREKPLPAWAVTFSQPDNCTVYVSAELGTFQAIRHNQWRVFDFFWMLHTMDYEGRDNFGNILLRAFSIFGLLTVLSGFVLYYVSSPSVRKVKKKIRA
ncbi:PepSY domain-containing protein [uncultured Pontibacter sp.]|uniref:PepSY domain-containing protein n=1 Tax=uncultured Pontibacter sp. TaxID=453356 RepID=UPI00262CABB3|nr:PepSY domain-containing protein [uncultured Pontibacter sp.]